ncbi:hypothetical protein [Shewanella psychrotolerans]|uniref:hypothetical protein n=1 Tax=Shewanella psychrotolerans TaxID=2864206 RepID=UPI001C65C5B4|nr:hypothetical protein [Shewanella psychrotolerans]QYK03412.1 hypothetical protein K0I62_07825 [Shewanella psychrotolerans]
MMWNWFSKLLNKKVQPKRRRVQVDIPIEQHTYRKAQFGLHRNSSNDEDKSRR